MKWWRNYVDRCAERRGYIKLEGQMIALSGPIDAMVEEDGADLVVTVYCRPGTRFVAWHGAHVRGVAAGQ